jgi:hypothetical protein
VSLGRYSEALETDDTSLMTKTGWDSEEKGAAKMEVAR